MTAPSKRKYTTDLLGDETLILSEKAMRLLGSLLEDESVKVEERGKIALRIVQLAHTGKERNNDAATSSDDALVRAILEGENES